MKRVLITGSRNWTDVTTILKALEELPEGSVICHGAAAGADTIAAEVAEELGIPSFAYPAKWREQGRAAGPIRNQYMLDDFKPDLVLAFPMPGSVGTVDMMKRAEKAGIPVVRPAEVTE